MAGEGSRPEGALRRVWNLLTRPSYALRDPSERWRAQYFAALLLAVIPVLLVIVIVRDALGTSSEGLVESHLVFGAIWLIAYALSRTARYRLGLRILCWAATAGTLAVMALRGEPWVFTNIGVLLVVAGTLLGRRDLLPLAGGSLLGLVAVRQLTDFPARSRDLLFMAMFVGMLVLAVEIAAAYQRRIHREQRAALAQSEARHRGLFELAFDGMVFVRDGLIVDSNRGFSRLTGRSRGELEGMRLSDVIEETGKPRAASSTETAVREARGKRTDGEPFYVEVVSRPQLADGRTVDCLAVRDITERRHAELQLSIAHRAVSMGTLAAGVAHEINNPLAWVRTNMELIGEGLAKALGESWRRDHPALAGAVDDSITGVERVELVVRDLGVLSRDDPEVGIATVSDAIDLAVRMAAKQLRTRARLIRDEQDVPPVCGHPSRLSQVFLNLLTNAAQSFQDGDRVDNEVVIRTRHEGETVVVEIADNGPGIDPDVLPHVFDPFFTTKSDASGTGLGLPISRSVVHGLGGRMTVRSDADVGTTFIVELPVAKAESVHVTTPSPVEKEETVETARVSVLVIDDEPLVGKSLVRALEGHDVIYCEHGEEAVSLLIERRFDLVLCDLMMPDMTGEDVFAQAPEAQRDRFVFMTGGAFTAQARAFLAQSDSPVLPKPFSTRDVRALLTTVAQQ